MGLVSITPASVKVLIPVPRGLVNAISSLSRRALSKIRLSLPGLILYARENRVRSMRSDFKRNILKVLSFLVEHTDILSGRVLWRLSDEREYATVTVSLVASRVKLSTRTVERIFALLERLGLLKTEPQPKPEYVHGMVLYSSCVRKLTDKLFTILGLSKQLKQDREYAKTQSVSIKQLFRCVIKKLLKPVIEQKPLWLQLKELERWENSPPIRS